MIYISKTTPEDLNFTKFSEREVNEDLKLGGFTEDLKLGGLLKTLIWGFNENCSNKYVITYSICMNRISICIVL